MNPLAPFARIPAAAWTGLFGWLLTLWLFYPGYASFDTAHQWYEVRHGQYTDHHPPLMALMWALTEPVLPGPGGPFLLQVSLYWAALATLAALCLRRALAQAAVVLAIGFAPPLFALLVHVWKDVALMAWLLAACAVLVLERRSPAPRRGLLVLAVLLLVVVGALRHNGLAAALPLVLYAGWRWFGDAARIVPALGLGLLTFAVVAVLAQVPAQHPRVERVQFWPTLALWDLAAVSIAENRMLIPESLHKQPLDVATLAQHFRPDVNVPLFAADLLKVSVTEPYDDDELEQLRRVWLTLPLHHTRAYLQHRLRLTRALVGLQGTGMPPPQDIMPGYTNLADNPPIHVPQLPLRTQAEGVLRQLSGSTWLAGWPWLLASLPLACLLWIRRRRPLAPLGLALILSAWCYARPLVVLSGRDELRYLRASLAACCASSRPASWKRTASCAICAPPVRRCSRWIPKPAASSASRPMAGTLADRSMAWPSASSRPRRPGMCWNSRPMGSRASAS